MKKPRMTKAERQFERVITLFVLQNSNAGDRLIDSEFWRMLNKETQQAYLTLIATKTR